MMGDGSRFPALADDLFNGSAALKAVTADGHGHGQRVVDVEAGVDRLQLEISADEQGRAGTSR